MSMSEYENQKQKQNHREWDDPFPSTIETGLPADFSEEDIEFARELETLFSAPDEILPPYYAQTLLQAEDPRYAVVDNAFAQKTRARVFRALKLRRHIFSQHRSLPGTIAESLREIVTRKSLMAWAAALMLVMTLTVAFTAPSFEQGMAILLRGSKSGVRVVKTAPNLGPLPPFVAYNYDTNPRQIPLISAQGLVHFNIFWPQTIPANYTLDCIKIYEDTSNSWADGPVVDLVYDIDVNRATLKGTGQIVVREFKPLQQVLQVVQDGNAYLIDPDQNGENPRAIYVDGQWLTNGNGSGNGKMSQQVWGRGGRSEIIYQQNGVVFWIAGDQRDGITQKVLWSMAQSLQTATYIPPVLLKNVMATILQPDSPVNTNNPFANDIISTPNVDGSQSQFYITKSNYLSGNVGSSKTPSRGH